MDVLIVGAGVGGLALARAARVVPEGMAGLLYERVIRSWSDALAG